jgi:hypothetical protein
MFFLQLSEEDNTALRRVQIVAERQARGVLRALCDLRVESFPEKA